MILLAISWYLLGVFGATLGTLSDLADGNDFKVSDLILCLILSAFGPATLALGLVAYVTNKNTDTKFNKTLIKGKK